MKAIYKFSLLFFSLGFVLGASAQANWKLTKNKDGIRIYQRDTKNSNFKSIKVECTFEGTLDKMAAIINNVNNYKNWIYNNKTASLLKRVNANEFYYYSESYLPWPMDNRDAVMHTRITKDSASRFLKINSVADPDFIPEKSGKVRITQCDINWHVTPVSSKTIHIVYTFETDPGGSVPSWIVNSFADKGPYESFKKLAEMLKK